MFISTIDYYFYDFDRSQFPRTAITSSLFLEHLKLLTENESGSLSSRKLTTQKVGRLFNVKRARWVRAPILIGLIV